jgi:hypothetical protein
MTNTITMSFDDWVEEFKPVQNHIDDNASFDGLMFETYGVELAFVRAQDINRIWTFIEQDGVFCVSEGMHIVKRLGYAITEKPYAENTFYIIEDDD